MRPSNPVGAKFSPFSRNYRPASYSVVTGSVAAGILKLVTDLHLLLRIRMGGAMPPLPLYSFMACTGTTLPLFILCFHILGNRDIYHKEVSVYSM